MMFFRYQSNKKSFFCFSITELAEIAIFLIFLLCSARYIHLRGSFFVQWELGELLFVILEFTVVFQFSL